MTASFSEKQLRAMTWWMPKSRDHGFDALVCDGAVRSGKTLAMGLGFFLWAMSCFTGRRFALCGKTRGGVRRNVVQELLPWLRRLGMTVSENRTAQVLRVRFAKRENEFYLFGGKDEGSAALIQGMTLAGVFLDEVVLMPRSFARAGSADARWRAAGCGSAATGGSAALVLSGMDFAGGKAQLPASAVYDAGPILR